MYIDLIKILASISENYPSTFDKLVEFIEQKEREAFQAGLDAHETITDIKTFTEYKQHKPK